MALGKADILAAAAKRLVKEIDVPRLGGAVRLRQLTAGDILGLPQDGDDGVRAALMLARAIVGDDDKRLFTDDEATQLLELPHGELQRLLIEVMAMNAMTADAHEDLAKN